jgi:hypothetical protein
MMRRFFNFWYIGLLIVNSTIGLVLDPEFPQPPAISPTLSARPLYTTLNLITTEIWLSASPLTIYTTLTTIITENIPFNIYPATVTDTMTESWTIRTLNGTSQVGTPYSSDYTWSPQTFIATAPFEAMTSIPYSSSSLSSIPTGASTEEGWTKTIHSSKKTLIGACRPPIPTENPCHSTITRYVETTRENVPDMYPATVVDEVIWNYTWETWAGSTVLGYSTLVSTQIPRTVVVTAPFQAVQTIGGCCSRN